MRVLPPSLASLASLACCLAAAQLLSRYRAVHYIFEVHNDAPEHGSSLLTFELQLKTFPSMIASDLYHNVIYKNLLPQTSASMSDTIKLYAWQNAYRELTLYYTNSQLKVEELLSPLASPSAAAKMSQILQI